MNADSGCCPGDPHPAAGEPSDDSVEMAVDFCKEVRELPGGVRHTAANTVWQTSH